MARTTLNSSHEATDTKSLVNLRESIEAFETITYIEDTLRMIGPTTK